MHQIHIKGQSPQKFPDTLNVPGAPVDRMIDLYKMGPQNKSQFEKRAHLFYNSNVTHYF